MANDFSNFSPELWSRRIQAFLSRTLVSRVVANMEEQAGLTYGDVIHRPYASSNALSVNDYTKGTAVTAQDISTTDESLSINIEKESTFYVDKHDEKQNKYNTPLIFADRAAYQLRNEIDGDFLDEISNAFDSIDDGDIGGTAGTAITLTTSNVIETFSSAQEKLLNNNVETDKAWYAVISPKVGNVIQQSAIASGFNVADTTFKNGYAGDFLGWKMLMSNNVRHTVSLGLATNPSENDTVVINGITFTFNATPSGAGSINIGGTAAESVDNIVACINQTGTADTDYIALSTDNQNKLKNSRVIATDGTTAMTLTASGQMTCSDTLTDTSDGFAAQVAHNYLARQGATDLVMQIAPTIQKNKSPLKTGYNYLTHDLYGIKTFVEGAQRMVDLQTIAQATTI
ncbi:MAG: hypothetical protein GY861_18435 [bacterium]|nr:hypothetical protein [bacterium]